jgi:hypothetical protein
MAIFQWLGKSSTGSKHALEVVHDEAGGRFTVVGATGKRHAAVILAPEQMVGVGMFIFGGTERYSVKDNETGEWVI